MSHSKHGTKALGGFCLLAAFGLMAFAAACAQGQTGWLANKAFITATQKIFSVIHPLANGKKHMSLLTELSNGTKVEILCESVETNDGLVFSNEKAEGRIALLFRTCSTTLNGKASSPCKPKEPISSSLKFHAILHVKGVKFDSKTYILLEPEGASIATLFFSEECAFGETVSITGDLVAECLNEKLEKNTIFTDYCLEDLTHHLIQEAPHNLFELGEGSHRFHELHFGLFDQRPVSLDGIADVRLNEGGSWAVHI